MRTHHLFWCKPLEHHLTYSSKLITVLTFPTIHLNYFIHSGNLSAKDATIAAAMFRHCEWHLGDGCPESIVPQWLKNNLFWNSNITCRRLFCCCFKLWTCCHQDVCWWMKDLWWWLMPVVPESNHDKLCNSNNNVWSAWAHLYRWLMRAARVVLFTRGRLRMSSLYRSNLWPLWGISEDKDTCSIFTSKNIMFFWDVQVLYSETRFCWVSLKSRPLWSNVNGTHWRLPATAGGCQPWR